MTAVVMSPASWRPSMRAGIVRLSGEPLGQTFTPGGRLGWRSACCGSPVVVVRMPSVPPPQPNKLNVVKATMSDGARSEDRTESMFVPLAVRVNDPHVALRSGRYDECDSGRLRWRVKRLAISRISDAGVGPVVPRGGYSARGLAG